MFLCNTTSTQNESSLSICHVMLIEILLIVSIALANCYLLGESSYAFFYNLIYGIILSTLYPLYHIKKHHEALHSLGIKSLTGQQVIILLLFVTFSIGGQMIQLIQNRTPIPYEKLKICFLPLVMTTFFEEFLFRGFIQVRMTKRYGSLLGILISGLVFSLYHLGYPGFRHFNNLALLFVVGCGFALAFHLSHQQLFVAYFVNLPNALLTYLLNYEQFPTFTELSNLFAGLSISVIICILSVYFHQQKTPSMTT